MKNSSQFLGVYKLMVFFKVWHYLLMLILFIKHKMRNSLKKKCFRQNNSAGCSNCSDSSLTVVIMAAGSRFICVNILPSPAIPAISGLKSPSSLFHQPMIPVLSCTRFITLLPRASENCPWKLTKAGYSLK